MHFLRAVAFAAMCIFLFDLTESKEGKVSEKKDIKTQDSFKTLESKTRKPSNTLKDADTVSNVEHDAKGTKENMVVESNSITSDKKGGHKTKTELHKSLDNEVQDKQTGQSKTKEKDKNRINSNGKKSSVKETKTKAKNKVSDKKEDLKSRNTRKGLKLSKDHKKGDNKKKASAAAKSDKSKLDAKSKNKTAKVENKTELRGAIPSNCNDIVEQYTNGKILMFEYKIKMKRCMTRKDALVTDQKALTKSSIAAGTDAFSPEAATPSERSYSFDPKSDYSESIHMSGPADAQTKADSVRAHSTDTAGSSRMHGTESAFDAESDVYFENPHSQNTAAGSNGQRGIDSAFDATTDEFSEHVHSSDSPAGSNGQGIDPAFDVHSMETIDQDQSTGTNEKFEDLKRTQLPGFPGASPQYNQPLYPAQGPEQQPQPLLQQNTAANFLPFQDQNQIASQRQVPVSQSAAAVPNSYSVLPGPDSYPQTPSFQNSIPFAARSNVPNPAPAAAAPAKNDANQAQTVMDQWRSNSFGVSAAKKSELPKSHAQIAQFMNSQQPAAVQSFPQPDATQQRSDIQPQPFQQQNTIQPQSMQRSDIQPQPLLQQNSFQSQSVQQRSDVQPQPQPQQAAFNQFPAGPETNLPF